MLTPLFGFWGLPIFFSDEFLVWYSKKYIYMCVCVCVCVCVCLALYECLLHEITRGWGPLHSLRLGTGGRKEQGRIRELGASDPPPTSRGWRGPGRWVQSPGVNYFTNEVCTNPPKRWDSESLQVGEGMRVLGGCTRQTPWEQKLHARDLTLCTSSPGSSFLSFIRSFTMYQ